MKADSAQSHADIFQRSFMRSIRTAHEQQLQEAFTALGLDRVLPGGLPPDVRSGPALSCRSNSRRTARIHFRGK